MAFDITKYDISYILEQKALYNSRIMIEDSELRDYFKKVHRKEYLKKKREMRLSDPEYILAKQEQISKKNKKYIQEKTQENITQRVDTIETFCNKAEISKSFKAKIKDISILEREDYIVASILYKERITEKHSSREQAEEWIVTTLMELEAEEY